MRVGVIGVGHLGRHHARLYAAQPDVTLAGVWDLDAAKTHAVAREYDTRPHDTLEALLDDVDAVSIAVPTISHASVALAALRAHRHVLVEKPIAATVDEADAMIAAARKARVTLMVGHVERFNPAVVVARAHIDGPVFIEAHRLAQFQPRALDVDVVLDLMIHDLDLVLAMIPEPVVHLDAVGIPVLTQTEDIANARLQFAGGQVVNLTASRVSKDRVRKLRIFQPHAYLSIDCAEARVEMFQQGDDRTLRVLRQAAAGGGIDPEVLAAAIQRVPLTVEPRNALADELAAFIAAARGECAASPSGEDGRAALALALRIRHHMQEAQRHIASTWI